MLYYIGIKLQKENITIAHKRMSFSFYLISFSILTAVNFLLALFFWKHDCAWEEHDRIFLLLLEQMGIQFFFFCSLPFTTIDVQGLKLQRTRKCPLLENQWKLLIFYTVKHANVASGLCCCAFPWYNVWLCLRASKQVSSAEIKQAEEQRLWSCPSKNCRPAPQARL